LEFNRKKLTVLLSVGSSFYSLSGITKADTSFGQFVNEDLILFSHSKDIYALGLQRGQAVRNIILNPKDAKAKENFDIAVSDSIKVFETKY